MEFPTAVAFIQHTRQFEAPLLMQVWQVAWQEACPQVATVGRGTVPYAHIQELGAWPESKAGPKQEVHWSSPAPTQDWQLEWHFPHLEAEGLGKYPFGHIHDK